MTEQVVHRRIAAAIEARIAQGHWQPGDQIPSRSALATEYGVHEQTIRLAVTLLRRAGVLEGEQRRRLFVAYPPAVRALVDPDAPWPHGSEVTDSGTVRATPDLAARLDLPAGTPLQREVRECWDPGGRSAMLITSWWPGQPRAHRTAIIEVGVTRLGETEAHALRLTVDELAYRVARTRLDDEGRPTETADLILPMDRWLVRFSAGEAPHSARPDHC